MKARCPYCGRDVQAVLPAGGDGSAFVLVRHDTTVPGGHCDGSRSIVDPDGESETYTR